MKTEINNDVIKENKLLVEKFPFLIPKDVPEEFNYDWTYLDDMPDGWKKAFGYQLCEELKEVLEALNLLDTYVIIQVKEKFGGLRWYDNSNAPEVEEVIRKYERLSQETCASCGKPAEYESTGWICPYCEPCAQSIVARRNETYKKIWETGNNPTEYKPYTFSDMFVKLETAETFRY